MAPSGISSPHKPLDLHCWGFYSVGPALCCYCLIVFLQLKCNFRCSGNRVQPWVDHSGRNTRLHLWRGGTVLDDQKRAVPPTTLFLNLGSSGLDDFGGGEPGREKLVCSDRGPPSFPWQLANRGSQTSPCPDWIGDMEWPGEGGEECFRNSLSAWRTSTLI